MNRNPGSVEMELDFDDHFIKFPGRITYVTTFIDCAIVCDDLLNRTTRSKDPFVIGFDMEWPFSFQTGSGKVALIQICADPKECFLLHVSKLAHLPKALGALLAHPNVRITGVNVKNDINKLARDFKIASTRKEKMLQNCIDTMYPKFVNEAMNLNTTHRWSMAKLVHLLFDMEIKKDKKVRNSKWAFIPLSKEQLEYAATDAYVSLLIYQHLEKLRLIQCPPENHV